MTSGNSDANTDIAFIIEENVFNNCLIRLMSEVYDKFVIKNVYLIHYKDIFNFNYVC